MTRSQHSATPLAGSTRLFHRGCLLRPVRHFTSHNQAIVPMAAKASVAAEKLEM